jgi:polysaccharide pyruvyl transferase WcaK-like protein
MVRAVRTTTSRSYRDNVSREFLAGQGIDTSCDLVVPDLVFGLTECNLPGYARPAAPARTVGLGVMGYYGWDANREAGARIYERYISQIADFARWLLEHGLQVRLLIGELRTDDAAVEDLLGRLDHGIGPDLTRNVRAEPIGSLADLLLEISRTDVVVASRYHNVVGALALGRPVIALGYASKFDALMGDAGLADYCQHVEHLDGKRLIQQFVNLSSEVEAAAERVTARSSQYRTALAAYFDDLLARLGEERAAAVAG